MASLQPSNTADARVRRILRDLFEKLDQAQSEIEDITLQEIARLGDDTPEARAWENFGGDNQFTDIGRTAHAIWWQLLAVRGCITYRGLDSSNVAYTPLNSLADSEQRDADPNDL